MPAALYFSCFIAKEVRGLYNVCHPVAMNLAIVSNHMVVSAWQGKQRNPSQGEGLWAGTNPQAVGQWLVTELKQCNIRRAVDADVNFACRPAHRTEAIQGRHSISSTGEKWGRTRKVTCGDGEIVVTHLRVMPKWVSSEIPTYFLGHH